MQFELKDPILEKFVINISTSMICRALKDFRTMKKEVPVLTYDLL
jgi:hypothetical protein